MNLITILYYVLTAILLGILGWNFVTEKESRDNAVLYLLVMVPLLLRLLRVK